LQSDGRRLATAVEVIVNVDARRTADAPFHYRRPRISGRGFARMEQPAVQRHLVEDVDVIDSFQVAPQKGTFSLMFWPGLCLTILLSLFCIMLVSERVLSVVKFLAVLGFYDTLIILVYNNNNNNNNSLAMPYARRSRRAEADCADEPITLLICPVTDKLQEIVTPRTLSDRTRGMSDKVSR